MEEIDQGKLSRSCRQICVQSERLVNRVLDREDLTAVQAHVLRYIFCRDQGGTSLTELHRAFGCSMATLSSVVKRLKEKGYVRAECCAGDDRCKLLFATEKGQRVHQELDGAVRAAERRIYSCFSPDELSTLDQLQRKLRKHLLSLMESEQKEVPNS